MIFFFFFFFFSHFKSQFQKFNNYDTNMNGYYNVRDVHKLDSRGLTFLQKIVAMSVTLNVYSYGEIRKKLIFNTSM